MLLDIKQYVTAKYLKEEITKSRADEILGVIDLELAKVSTEHDFQIMVEKLMKTQFPELKGYFEAYRVKASEQMDHATVEKIDEHLGKGELSEAEMLIAMMEEMELA